MNKKEITRAVWKLAKGYWNSDEKWKARGLLAAVVVMTVAQVYLLLIINSWYNDFYNSLQSYDYDLFLSLIGKFTVLAFIYIFIYVYCVYLTQMLEIRWRTWMTNHYLSNWMDKQVYYRMKVVGTDLDNPDQRIAEDVYQYVCLTMNLGMGIFRQLGTLIAFVFVLWDLSGMIELPIGDAVVAIPGYMVIASLIYACIGTGLVHLVGRKLIGLNYDQQRFEANFRFNLIRVRENSESIAFYKGETPELMGFKETFSHVVDNFWGLMRQTKLLNFYEIGYEQIAIIFPIIMAAPKYFGGAMALGGLMQTLSAFGRVQNALSYFVSTYDSIAKYISVIRRLAGFTLHMKEVEGVDIDYKCREATGAKGINIDNVNVKLPDGRILLADLELKLGKGDSMLISGSSGCGKSTLLRLLAGIWPYGDGELQIAEGDSMMFLPQRPYLPLGSLRQAIYYPQPVPENVNADDTKNLYKMMEIMGVGHLQADLDKVDDWSRILSLGEQQRLAFIRILLKKPQVVFLDEATSALDEENERNSYNILRSELPETIVVSVAHRSSLKAVHNHVLKLNGDGSYEFN